MKKRLLGSLEVKAIISVIILLAIIFGFNDGSNEFIFSDWVSNLILIIFVVALVILVNVLGSKLASKYYGTEIKIKVWNSQKFKQATTFTKKIMLIYTTPILNILVALISNGKIYLSSVMSFDYEKEVMGRKFPYITYFNVGMVVFFGLLFNLVLMWIFKLLSFEPGLKISFWFILFSLIPFSELPGARLLTGSITLYVFSLVFFLANIILLQAINSFFALMASIFFSVIVASLYVFFFRYNSK